jgi:hypothetical protein
MALSPCGRPSRFRVNDSFVEQLVASDLKAQAAGARSNRSQPDQCCLGATGSRLFRRAYCHAGYRLHANKVVAHTFNSPHILGCENKCPTLSLIENRSPEFHCAVAHDDIDQTELRPTLLFQLRQEALTNRYVIGRCRIDLAGQAGERMKQVGATDDSDELGVTRRTGKRLMR